MADADSATTTCTSASAYCISFADVQAAAQRIEGTAHRTPVLTSQSINDLVTTACTNNVNVNLFFKVEALQKTGSFKFRGALNAVRSILEEQQQQRQKQQQQQQSDGNNSGGGEDQQQQQQQQLAVVTHSSGNHAQALALAARLSCTQDTTVTATIVMPESAPRVKTRAVIGFGGIPVVVASTNEAREEACERLRFETGAAFVHPSEDPRVIAGQGTVCLELAQQVREQQQQHHSVPQLDVVIIPVGGGGLAAGNVTTLRAVYGGRCKIVLAEPAEMDDAKRSFDAQTLLPHHPGNPLNSVADGLKTTLGPNTWPIIRDQVDDVLTVSEEEILRATSIVWERLKIMIEPSAGVGVAVALYNAQFRDKYCCCADDGAATKNVGIVLCGGNVDVIEIAAKMREVGL